MPKEEFAKILKEYGFKEREIQEIWERRPKKGFDESKLRNVASWLVPPQDHFAQA